MSSARKLVCALTVLLAVALMAPVAALASGSPPSAGDQQYIDPLGTQTTTSTSASPTPAPTASSSATPTTTPATTTSSSTSTADTSTDPSSKTLPYTGFDVWAGVGLGLCLLGSGVYLRRVLARQE